MPDSLLGGIVINEILVDPNGANNFDTDGNGTADATDEFVELLNTSNVAIDISGLELWDAGVGNWFTFPPGTILQAGAHALVIVGVQSGGSLPTGGANDLFFDAGRGSAAINNGADNITLYDPSNDEFVQAVFNGDSLDDPTLGGGGYSGFSSTATRQGAGEDFGNDTDGLSIQREGGGNTFATGGPTPGTGNVCFGGGTRLLSAHGEVAIEALKAGDRLVTADHGQQTVRWVFAKSWTRAEVLAMPQLRAVKICQGALGIGLPAQDLLVSQQHRVVVSGPIAKRMFGESEVFVPAKSLLALEGVYLDVPEESVTYFHVLLERHEVLFSNGLASESLFLGSMALASLPASALAEVEAVMGAPLAELCRAPARALVTRARAMKLVQRHRANDKPLALQWSAMNFG